MTKTNVWKSFLLAVVGALAYATHYLLTTTHDNVITVVAVYLGAQAAVVVVYLVFLCDKKKK